MVTTRSGKEIKELIKDVIKQKSGKKETKEKNQKKIKSKLKKKMNALLDDSSDFDDSEIKDDITEITEISELESEFDEEAMFEESYTLPKHLKDNLKLKRRFDTLVTRIKNQEPTLEQILQLKIRPKRKVDLLQHYYIYKYSCYPHSEEKYYMKKDLNAAIEYARKEYNDFCLNKKKFLKLEKTNKSENDIMVLKRKLLNLDTTKENLSILYQKFNALESRTEGGSEEYYKALTWMKSALSIPFNRIVSINTIDENIEKFLSYTKEKLDEELFGMEIAKEQILLYLHDRIKNPNTMSCPLALIGSPGMGKTSIALSLAKIMRVPFQAISMGGVSEPTFLSGHCSTYIGSKPGRIASSMITTQSNNPILFFDEIDKIENHDVVSSLLHIMDSTQNSNYRDSYFGQITIDLSRVFFICSMNDKPKDRALADRLSYISIPDYSEKEKIVIVEKYLLPKGLKNVGLNHKDIFFSDSTITYLVKKINPGSSGIRKLKEAINSLISKILFSVNNRTITTSFTLDRNKYCFNSLTFPFQVKEDIIDHLLKDYIEKPNTSFQHLYI